jgi:hypothetical protein
VSYTGGSIESLFADAERLAEDAAIEMADAAGEFATATARRLAPVGPRTDGRDPGTLRDSYQQIETHRVQHDDGNTAYASGVESDDYVARWAEWGTKAHEIRPRIPGGVLVFRTWPSGEKVRVTVVRQPGLPGKHVVTRALDATEREFPALASPALERWQRRQEAAARARR